jgi:hypothetical protein
MPTKLETLERLTTLRDRGALSEEEFQAEKAAVFGPSITEVIPEPAAVPETPRGDRKSLWESFRPVRSLGEAEQLLKAGLFTALVLVGNGVIDLGVDVSTAMDGYAIEPGISNSESITFGLIGLAVFSALVVLAAWGVVRRKSRFAAIALVPLACLDLIASLMARWDGNGTFRLATLLIGGAAVLLAVQAVRATYAYRRFKAGI